MSKVPLHRSQEAWEGDDEDDGQLARKGQSPDGPERTHAWYSVLEWAGQASSQPTFLVLRYTPVPEHRHIR